VLPLEAASSVERDLAEGADEPRVFHFSVCSTYIFVRIFPVLQIGQIITVESAHPQEIDQLVVENFRYY
jgi:hypothetical protein